jgi:hypothetical protein
MQNDDTIIIVQEGELPCHIACPNCCMFVTSVTLAAANTFPDHGIPSKLLEFRSMIE